MNCLYWTLYTIYNAYFFSFATMVAWTHLFYAKGTLPVLLYFLLAPLFYLDICKHGDNKAYATPSKTDETRIRTSGKLFT